MLNTDEILEKFASGFDCAQVILEHYCENYGVSTNVARKLSTGFGGGCMRGETCGAIVGAYMALGLKYGIFKDGEEGQNQKVESCKKCEEFNKKFKEIYNSFECRELLHADISTKEGMKEISDKNLMTTFCPALVSDVTKILDEML